MAGLIGKLSIKTLGCTPEAAVVSGNETDLCDIMGKITSLVVKIGSNGDPVIGLVGSFEGVNLTTGEVSRSGVAYLPSGIAEMFTSKFEGDGDHPPVAFALRLSSFKASNPRGYSFRAREIVEAQAETDPLEELRQARNAYVQKMLPPPAEEPKAPAKK